MKQPLHVIGVEVGEQDACEFAGREALGEIHESGVNQNPFLPDLEQRGARAATKAWILTRA
jgi:hypothetical protein